MDKESIIREWFYRLPKGYAEPPYTKAEMDILHEVLNENGLNGSVFVNEAIDPGPKRNFKPYGDKYTEYEKATNPDLKEIDQLDQAFLDAKPVKDSKKKHSIGEGHNWLIEQLLKEVDFDERLFNIAIEQDKQGEFDRFVALLPEGEPKLAAIKYLNSLDDKTLTDKFFKGLYSDKAPTTTMKLPGGFETDLFNIDAKGIGKGELWGAWKFEGAEVQGGTESFDLQVIGTKYEVKDYSGKKAKDGKSEAENKNAIRVGVEGSVSKYNFWNQILETVNKLKKANAVKNVWRKLPGGAEGAESADWKKLFGKEDSLKDYILDRVEKQVKVVTGEFNKTDTKKFIEFYTTMNKLFKEIGSTEVNQISARGPNQKPVSIVIDPVPLEDFPDSGEFTINISDRTGGATPVSVINFFKELEYVRKPESFMRDINAAVADIIRQGEANYWMVFRGKASDITVKIINKDRADEFQFSTISQNGIKFIEPGE